MQPTGYVVNAEWLADLLDVLGVVRPWAVSNSFGASVAWSLAVATLSGDLGAGMHPKTPQNQ